ncbi:phosphoacetylglucosamine mutase [Schizosaccharomyces cryophilus OY26]|uniref:Phosphoacetylglucosamine mutase n=1 Tax=Schizosaccharomyces cryophilus (strain OY26 / ATCC MYA-4695 / CBS 11777 / NBRC 106824 / NRRL Y48691) TaxID=653667 RepID=S9W226_SCHCR|nr:phosphoacetylglucosamine mutase [Schizosaccharomyces cryophilus OY26]EPY54098.1 phosphoacetylglucosamine mutase [Schizosaccharomyces cryophilus OY26]
MSVIDDDIFHETVAKLVRESDKFPKTCPTPMRYNIGGYRASAEFLSSAAFRIGIIATLLSTKLHSQPVGVMITASHTVPAENVLKIVNVLSSYDTQKWEGYLDQVVNADSADELTVCLSSVLKKSQIPAQINAQIFVAYDTRPFSRHLAEPVMAAAEILQARCIDYHVLSTPQLHYIVKSAPVYNTADSIGAPTEEGYFHRLSEAFHSLMASKQVRPSIVVDAANGVGAIKLKKLMKEINPNFLHVEVVNDHINCPEELNNSCGIDYVLNQQRPPLNVSMQKDVKYVSFDADADRLLYYYSDSHSFHILDGDKIASLFALYLLDLIRAAGLQLQLGLVQTAYANGASTSYIQKTLKIPVTCVSPGLKNLQWAAQAYDIGIYFEANGHGSIVFSPSALSIINTHEVLSPAQFNAIKALKSVIQLVNPACGDALANMLLVEVVLAYKNCFLREWNHIFVEIPSRLIKCEVPDRSIYTTADAERKLITPEGLQQKIDALVAKYTNGRAFVRPSDTEDATRVYAEASTRSESEDLALRIVELLQ